jgi:tight adherence protein C
MPAYVYLGAAMISTAVVVLVFALHGARVPAQLVRSNLSNAPEQLTDLRAVVLTQPTRERVVKPFVGRMAHAARRLTPKGLLESLERKVNLAGTTDRWPLERVLAAKLLLGGVGAIVGALLVVNNPSGGTILLAAAACAIGFLAPDAVLSSKASERQQLIERELPDVLDQVTICVEAGLGFEAALQRTALTGDGPLGQELARALQDISLGMSRRSALDQMLERTDVSDLRHFVLALGQAERHGVPIAQVLRIQAAELREKRRQRAEERALKLPVKLVFPLVVCILPALFIVLLGPAAIRIGNSSFGG